MRMRGLGKAGLGVLAVGIVLALGACHGSNPPSGGGGNNGGGNTGGGSGGGGQAAAFRAFAFNDDLIFGTNQNQQGPAAWVWLMAEVASGHTNHQPEQANSASGPWSPVPGVQWSGPAVNGGNGPGVLFTFAMPTSTTYYRVSATDGSGNTVVSNVVVADPSVSANPAQITISAPSVSNDPQNPAIVNAPSAIDWSGASASSHVVVIVDLSAQDYHTLAEKQSASYAIGSNGDTPLLIGGGLTTGNIYAVEVIGLDGNGWGNATSADVALGFNNFFEPQ